VLNVTNYRVIHILMHHNIIIGTQLLLLKHLMLWLIQLLNVKCNEMVPLKESLSVRQKKIKICEVQHIHNTLLECRQYVQCGSNHVSIDFVLMCYRKLYK